MSAVAFPAPASPSKNKENTPGHATPVLAPLDKTTTKGRKRTITLVNGDTIDLGGSLPVSPQVIESMRLRIIELEDQLAASEERPAKRAKAPKSADDKFVPGPSSSVPSAASIKADEKKRKLQVKKMFDQLKKECKSDTCKFQGSPKTVKMDEIYEYSDFQSLFKDKGTLIQPTQINKPSSTVTIIRFTTKAQIQAFFGNELKQLKGNRWSRGGIPQRSFGFFGDGGCFSKSVKQGSIDVSIQSIEVNYSKNTMKCTLKFEVAEDGYYDDDYY